MLRTGFVPFLTVLPVVLALSGCGANPDTGSGETIGETVQPVTGSEAVSRAMQWVDAKLQYCQAANHKRDYDNACSTYCNRQHNPAWDPYRSDCSGLISWAWGLAPPGLITTDFAPYSTSVAHEIDGASLSPGDALNNTDHVVLFKEWVTKGSRATFIEEPGCSTTPDYAHTFTSDVSINGSAVYISYEGRTFYAIRYDQMQAGADWAAQFVQQSFPYASQGAIDMTVGQTVTESITMKNIGAKPWTADTKLAPTPRDQPSPFYDPSWPVQTRIAAAVGTVAPGGDYTFDFKLHAAQAGTRAGGTTPQRVGFFLVVARRRRRAPGEET